MGLTSFAIANIFFSFAAKDDVKSVLSLDTFDDRRFVIATGVSIASIILGTELGIFQHVLGTEHLAGKWWLLCIAVALPVVVVSEIRKLIERRRLAAAVA
jgi:Ca2+-transporting ATPase